MESCSFDSILKMYLKEHGQNQICSVSCVREKVGKCPRVWEKTVKKYNKGKLYKEVNSFYFVVKRYNSNGKYFGDGDGAHDFSGNGLWALIVMMIAMVVSEGKDDDGGVGG